MQKAGLINLQQIHRGRPSLIGEFIDGPMTPQEDRRNRHVTLGGDVSQSSQTPCRLDSSQAFAGSRLGRTRHHG
jgi:hypothetical protein